MWKIGEDDWLAQEYRREGFEITEDAARRLAKEHMLDCDSRKLKTQHEEFCAADRVKAETARSRRAEDRGQPNYRPRAQSARKGKTTLK